ncbi:dihydroorotate dehydrogenase [Saccharicrinis sp. FJH62]|uniref:dihydroorotate dehydrogenase n=1 Tax=Saccharicrinis sp. FJH62 TaxID=3344657 RepID=UPI0035D4EA5B
MADLKVNIGNLELENPVMAASGTFGYGEEFEDFIDLNALGGYVVKGTTLEHREGNKYPRMAETASGMLNAVGLQNKGVDYFINHIYPRLTKYSSKLFVNVSGSKVEDYAETSRRLADLEHVAGIELNISCPNVKEGGMTFGTSCPSAAAVTKAVRAVYPKHLMVKLSPNVTDVTEIARVLEAEGADSLSLINTLLAMAIDAKTRRPKLSTVTGGLSGPAVKPVALRMVWQVYNAVKIPLVGMGGIMNATDAIEFMLAGSTAIQIGTANFIDPAVSIKVKEGINAYLDENGFKSATELVGALEV